MTINDFTIPEAEVAYQKLQIEWGWKFFILMVVLVFIYGVARLIVENEKDRRAKANAYKSIQESGETGRVAWEAMKCRERQENRRLRAELARKEKHIAALEGTLEKFHFGDVAERIRKENEDGTNSSENRS